MSRPTIKEGPQKPAGSELCVCVCVCVCAESVKERSTKERINGWHIYCPAPLTPQQQEGARRETYTHPSIHSHMLTGSNRTPYTIVSFPSLSQWHWEVSSFQAGTRVVANGW